MIIYCQTESDVAIALSLANLARLRGGAPFTVRSGGHRLHCRILSQLRRADRHERDEQLRHRYHHGRDRYRAEWRHFGAFRSALTTYGVHVPGGECDDVCIGGYMRGWWLRLFTSVSFGMNCDCVLSIKVMLFDGSIVMATPATNYDLFWAMRGGTGAPWACC